MAKRKYTKRNVEPSFTLSELEQYGFGDFLKESGKYVKDLARSGADLMLTSTLIPGANRVIKKSDYETDIGKNYNLTNYVGDTQTTFWDSSLNSFGATNAIKPDAYETDLGRKAGESSDKNGLLGGKAAAGILGTWFGGPAGGAAAVGGMDKLQKGVGSKYGTPANEADDLRNQQIAQQQYNNALARFNPKVGENTPVFRYGGKFPDGGGLPSMADIIGKDTLQDDVLGTRRREISRLSNINDPKLYENPEDASAIHAILRETGNKQAVKDYTNNWNRNFGAKDKGYYDPDALGLDFIDPSTPFPAKQAKFKELLKQYNTPATTGTSTYMYAGNAGYGNKPNLAKKGNGGYVMEYGGASHDGGGIPVDGTTGNPTAIMGGKPNAEVENKEVGVKFPGEETPFIFSEKLGYAKQAKKIQNKYSKRPNDSISQDAMYMELGGLMQAQEAFKAKKIQYHQNKLKQFGGPILGDNIVGNEDYSYANGGDLLDPTNPEFSALGTSKFSTEAPKEEYSPYSGSAMPMITSAAGNLAMMLDNKRPDTYRGAFIAPEEIDLSSARRSIQEQSATSKANKLRALRQAGLSPAQYASLVSTSDIDLNRGTNLAMGESYMQEQTQNANARADAARFNAAQSTDAAKTNLSLQDQYKRQQAEYLKSALETVPEYFGQRERYDTLNATSPNYDIVTDPKSKWYNRRPKFVPKTR